MLVIAALTAASPRAHAFTPSDTGLLDADNNSQGPLGWSYVGPIDQVDRDTVIEHLRSRPAGHLRSMYGDFSEAVQVDAAGDLWIVDNVDWPAFIDRELAYTLDAGQSPTDFAALQLEDEFDTDTDEEPGSRVLLNWTAGICSIPPFGLQPWALWWGESRSAAPAQSTMDPRERRTVMIYRDVPEEAAAPWCSGVLIDPTHILTAAHCVVDAGGWPIPPPSVNMYATTGGDGSYTNSVTRTITSVFIDGVPWNGQTRRDYAILRTSQPFNTGYMLMSNESNATLETYPTFNTGYPARINGSSCTNTNGLVYSQVVASSTVVGHVSGRGTVRTVLDGTVRQSGSPIYSCPAGDPQTCTGGQSGTVYGLVAEIKLKSNGTVDDVRGPRVPNQLRSWALGILP